MPGLDGAADEFRDLAKNLRLVGADELRRELYKGINDAAQPLARQIRDPEHLKPYMPDRYAAVLAADLAVTTSKRTGIDPGVFIRARGRGKNRHVQRIDQASSATRCSPTRTSRGRTGAGTRTSSPGSSPTPRRRPARRCGGRSSPRCTA